MYGPATKHGNGYTYESSFVQAGGPSHPNPAKSALFTLTTNGILRMIWSQNNNRIEETTIELESVSSSDDVITHAAFASEKSAYLPHQPNIQVLTTNRAPTSRLGYKFKAIKAGQDRDTLGPNTSARQERWPASWEPQSILG